MTNDAVNVLPSASESLPSTPGALTVSVVSSGMDTASSLATGGVFVPAVTLTKTNALAKALQALRPYAKRKLVVVFGAGGDRDAGKRPLMGAIATEYADRVIVTDDNPRNENPDLIRSAILSAAKGAKEIGDRAEAIRTAIAGLEPGDALLIAGKGHETGQIIGDRVVPFSDHDAVAAALQGKVA